MGAGFVAAAILRCRVAWKRVSCRYTTVAAGMQPKRKEDPHNEEGVGEVSR